MFREMKFVFLSLCLSVLGCAEKKTETQTPVERSKYLVTVTSCNDCHTPKIAGPGGSPVLDETRLLAGHSENAPYPPTWTPRSNRASVFIRSSTQYAWIGLVE